MTEENKYKSLNYLTISEKYLHLVENVSFEVVKQGNRHVITSNRNFDDKEYEEKTKWSDFNISIPSLFNLYHGIELLLKGLLILDDNYIKKADHKISLLLAEFKDKYPREERIISVLKKYIEKDQMHVYLNDFLKDNNFEVDNLYEALRYPTNKKGKEIYFYFKLKYRGEFGCSFYRDIANDMVILRTEMTKIFRGKENIKD